MGTKNKQKRKKEKKARGWLRISREEGRKKKKKGKEKIESVLDSTTNKSSTFIPSPAKGRLIFFFPFFSIALFFPSSVGGSSRAHEEYRTRRRVWGEPGLAARLIGFRGFKFNLFRSFGKWVRCGVEVRGVNHWNGVGWGSSPGSNTVSNHALGVSKLQIVSSNRGRLQKFDYYYHV